jgi:hypothetical protein
MKECIMARRTCAIVGLALGLSLAAELLTAPDVAAQRAPTVPGVAPIVAGVVVVSIAGINRQGGRADVDVDRERSRTPGRVVVR